MAGRAMTQAAASTFKSGAAIVLTTRTGRPWTPRYFKAQWETAVGTPASRNCIFHDLRGTAVTMLAEAGCTTPQIAAITGHSLRTVTSILDRYLARTRALATSAVMLFENAKSTEFANRLQTKAAKPGADFSKRLK
jgi:integrase